MKTISLEASKILQKKMPEKTEFIYQLLPNSKNDGWLKSKIVKNWNGKGIAIKTLNLEEGRGRNY